MNHLRNHRYRGPSGMRAEHLKGWLSEARKEEAAAAKEKEAEGALASIGGTGGKRRRRGRLILKR